MIITDIHEEVDKIKKRLLPMVEFQLPVTNSGIQIAGGPTTITKRGIVIGTVPMMNGVNQTFGLLIKEEGQSHIALVDIGSVKWLEE